VLSPGEDPAEAAPAPARSDGPAREGGASTPFGAVILAGGRAARLGGADKPGLVVGAGTLLAAVVSAAAAAGAGQLVVVGPDRPELSESAGGIEFVLEEPPGSGPVPALRRGLAEMSADVVAVLAADLPFLRARHLEQLLDARGARSGAILLDDAGRPQWLAGCWRTEVLRAAARAHRGSSLRGLLGPLDPVPLRYDLAAGEPPPWLDCDTAEDLRRARAWRERAAGPSARLAFPRNPSMPGDPRRSPATESSPAIPKDKGR
jgi:molybdopterin-guanine dinucleotide biosynthesis protein A